jgi:Mu transposase, C-terminal
VSANPAARRGVLRLGDRVRFDGGEHTVVGLSGVSVRLAGDDGVDQLVLVTHLQVAPDFALLSGSGPASLPPLGLLEAASAAAVERARWWERHLVEVETGLPPDAEPAARPRPGYDPAQTTLIEREQAKAAELSALGQRVSHRTLRRRRAAYAASGIWGLVDQRAVKASSPTGRVDERVVVATRQALAEQTETSTGTRGRVRRRVQQLLDETHGPGVVTVPPPSTFYRLLAGLDAGGHAFGAATTRRSLANRPDGPFGTVLALRPGQLVQIDTTPLDVLAVLDDGMTGRVELTTLLDLATRTLCAAVLRPHGTKAVDVALLLARALVPEPMRPGWPEALRMRASRLPHRDLAWADERLADAAAKPVITPETIVCDRGAVFLSETFLSACARLGISVQPAHPRTPTDKPVVERTFSSINTLFCQYVAGYTGRDVTRRGVDVEQRGVWPIGDLQDLLDEWVIACWQHRPHDGLRHPDVPRAALSPNEMYAALIAPAGYAPLALSAQDYLELLPVAWRRITAEGIRLGYLTYDSDVLNPLRGQSSGIAARSGRWEVHYDPYDLSRVWLRGTAGQWLSVPWIHAGRDTVPFADFTLRHVRRLLAERGADGGQQEIARALDELLTRTGNGPTPIPRTSRRVAARTRAATATPLRTVNPPTDGEPDSDSATAPVDPETPSNGAGGGAVVIPFGVFDADKEAERFW